MPEGAPIELACAARRDYLAHCATTLASVLERRPGRVRVNLLVGDDVSDDELGALADMVAAGGGELAPLRVDAGRLRGLATTETLPVSHWYRVLLPMLLPAVNRLLYLDCDLIALDSIAPLAATDLGGHPLGAVANVFPDPRTAPAYVRGLGLERPEDYFNSGVLVMDLAAMREADLTERVLVAARSGPPRGFLHEQDYVNTFLTGGWARLDPRWNVMLGIRRFEWARDLLGAEAVGRALADPGILHFEGSGANKPWHPDADPADRELWLGHRARTPWPELGSGPGGA